MLWAKLPLLLHTIIETAAALSFICKPEAQLPAASDDARLILQSYGGLLLSSNILCVLFLARPGLDSATGLVALGVASYHLWPARRAFVRIHRGIGIGAEQRRQTRVLGGPSFHFVVHVVCFVALMGTGLVGLRSA
ncbi:hypothetical protein QBC33DRAFT_558658 [Phialemonium atrogriseum]|uniref:DUF4149 domain-containing protein n=1 Tax=Phialemonium atrogriseum TaxID=1093897 RepID=A0AAJ0C0C1_9PEZI|nr:uncharacterized protein QBC33DRAFT_558658 [Phialemonium atrogriseum]KAK1767828.1 hypothetical protein QBC33DRAFT_558658 [Phialemonium atrogriseum]